MPFRAPIQSTGALPESATSTLVLAAAGDPVPNGESAAPVQLPSSDLAQRYCVSIAEQAAEARIALQKAKLAEAEQQIDQRIAALEAKTAEFRTWLERREKFSRKVTQKLAQIYAKMEPDAAAAQLVSMDEEAAASILAKLDPRNSSAVMNEMQPAKAARLAATLVGAARASNKKPAAPNPAAEGPPDGPPGGPPEQARPPGQSNGNGGEL
jgi:flagellar motility protein MotE (MotC chaperone)